MKRIAVGDMAPDFVLLDNRKQEVRLSDLRGKKVLLSWHPLAWTGVCANQMKALEENLEKKKELWQYLKKKDMRSFIRIRYGILGQTMNIPGKSGRKISSLVYIVARRLIGFN